MTDPLQPSPVPPPASPGAPAAPAAQPGYPAPAAPAPVPPAGYPAYPAAPIAQPGVPAPGAPQNPYPAPGYGAPAYQAPAGAFTGPATGYQAPFTPPVPPAGPGLGRVALILALVAAVLVPIAAGFLAYEIGHGAAGVANISRFTGDLLPLLTPVRDYVLWLEIAGWAGTAFGIWALVQGIVAIVKQRGRGAGIAALVLAVLGPIVFAVLAYGGLILGAGLALAGSTTGA